MKKYICAFSTIDFKNINEKFGAKDWEIITRTEEILLQDTGTWKDTTEAEKEEIKKLFNDKGDMLYTLDMELLTSYMFWTNYAFQLVDLHKDSKRTHTRIIKGLSFMFVNYILAQTWGIRYTSTISKYIDWELVNDVITTHYYFIKGEL